MSGFEEDTWTPPTEAEMKLIQAKRERTDKISQLIGQYLLKGYKMLATTCPQCDAIEMEDRSGQLYCVACSEVDCQETSKDNPTLSREAARSALREDMDVDSVSSRLLRATAALPTVPLSRTRGPTIRSSLHQVEARTDEAQAPAGELNLARVTGQAVQSVLQRVQEARIKIDESPDVLATENYIRFLKVCAETIAALEAAAR